MSGERFTTQLELWEKMNVPTQLVYNNTEFKYKTIREVNIRHLT